MHNYFCNTCNDAGYLGFIRPGGFLAGEIGDCWPFTLLIRRECPRCHGDPKSQMSKPLHPGQRSDKTHELVKMAMAAVPPKRELVIHEVDGVEIGMVIGVDQTITRDVLNRNMVYETRIRRIVSDVEQMAVK